jgi:nitroimidazol reductase NimA-like FMN-containing flavoprotein (pyridoxamine 5'-phosphate oxidase superfamily)
MDATRANSLFRVRRMPERGRYDRASIYSILDATFVCQVAYNIEQQPVITPTAYWRTDNWVYWHGSSASRMLRCLGGGAKACFCANLLDGVVFARSGFNHSLNYRSVVAFGVAELVDDTEAKLAALREFSERLAPGRWDEVRSPSPQELKATTILRMELNEASAKIRTGGPGDPEADCLLACWAGVVPIRMNVGIPETDTGVPSTIPVPGYLSRLSIG